MIGEQGGQHVKTEGFLEEVEPSWQDLERQRWKHLNEENRLSKSKRAN